MVTITLRDSGDLVAVCDKAPYVAQNDNGIWHESDEAHAEAVSICGTKYALSEEMPVVEPTFDEDGNEIGEQAAPVVVVTTVEGGTLTMDLIRTSGTHTGQIEDLEIGMVDQTITTEERIGEIEQALCELAMATA